MDAHTRRSRTRWIVAVTAAALLITLVVAITIGVTHGGAQTEARGPEVSSEPTPAPTGSDGDDMNRLTPSPTALLDQQLGGQEAIDALGDKIAIVAKRNGKTVDEVKALLLRDKSARVSTSGFIVYVDDFGKQG